VCASVICLPIHPLLRRVKSLSALKSGEALTIAYFRDERLMRWIAETFARWRPTEAFVFCSSMAPYLDGYRFATRVIDMVDVDSEKWHQYADKRSWPMKAIYRREAQKLRQVEITAARNFDYTLFSSAPEASLFLKRTGRSTSRVLAMRNGVDYDFFDPAKVGANPYPQGRKSIAFTGAMDYWPNIEAAQWFVSDVMTALRHRFPAFDFWIVGSHRRPGCAGWRAGIFTSPAAFPISVLILLMPMRWWRRCRSRAASRIKCSKRWRWVSPWSRRRRHSKVSISNPAPKFSPRATDSNLPMPSPRSLAAKCPSSARVRGSASSPITAGAPRCACSTSL
jgi:hypothetical protein